LLHLLYHGCVIYISQIISLNDGLSAIFMNLIYASQGGRTKEYDNKVPFATHAAIFRHVFIKGFFIAIFALPPKKYL